MIYPHNQKPPIWSIDPGIIAYNCKKAGMPHPVLAMPMWDRAGDLVIDYSGHGNHGTNNGADWVSDGLSINDADIINLDHNSSLIQTDEPFTVIVNYYPTLLGSSSRYIISSGNPGSGYADWGVASYNNDIYFGLDGVWRINVTCLTLNKWMNVAVKYDGSYVYVYLDGVEVKKAVYSGGHTYADNGMQIGGNLEQGIYKDATVYNTDLTSGQTKFIHENPYFMYEIPEELYGYAAAAVGGWTGEIIGITNPSEILGRATSGITEVMGLS